MEQLALTLGIAVVSFLILFFVFKFDQKEHVLLRLLGVFFFIFILLLIPKSALDYQNECDFVVNKTRETYIYGDNFSGHHWDYVDTPNPNTDKNIYLFHKNVTYTYDYVCSDTENSTASIFYKTYMSFIKILAAYIFVYLFYVIFLKNNVKFCQWLDKIKGKK